MLSMLEKNWEIIELSILFIAWMQLYAGIHKLKLAKALFLLRTGMDKTSKEDIFLWTNED